MEYVDGVTMNQLSDDQHDVVQQELNKHVITLHNLRSNAIGGPPGLVVPPHRVMLQSPRDEWKLRPSPSKEFVFCHNDLSQQNVIVDLQSLKIRAIIDWEYAGFYPAFFEGAFYRRPGPSVALEGEIDDADRLLAFLVSKLEL